MREIEEEGDTQGVEYRCGEGGGGREGWMNLMGIQVATARKVILECTPICKRGADKQTNRDLGIARSEKHKQTLLTRRGRGVMSLLVGST